jgi:ribosomal protein L12E/L44/L45/RPP1/RPP2
VIKASGNEVEAYWPSLFAKALKGQNIEDLLSNIGSAPVAAEAAPVQAAADAKKGPAEKKGNLNIHKSFVNASVFDLVLV